MMKSVQTRASCWTALALGFLAAVTHLPAEPPGPGDMLVTVAGSGADGFAGDGGPALQAGLSAPCAVAVDAAGNLFIADQNHARIRKVDAWGIITTVAGGGANTYGGDGGPARRAGLAAPCALAVDAAGDLFIADYFNARIRKVDLHGIITTVAGNGASGFAGDGGPATQASLSAPSAVAVDAAGNLFIADENNYRVRKVDPQGIITTVAGNGTNSFSGDGWLAVEAGLSAPKGVAVDPAGNLYIADENNHRIRRVDQDGFIHTVAGNGTAGYSGDGGPATAAGLFYPCSLAVDVRSNLYFADAGTPRVRRVDARGIITTVAGNGDLGFAGDGGPATAAALANPQGVAVDAGGRLWLADQGNDRIRAVPPPPALPSARPLPSRELPPFCPASVSFTGGRVTVPSGMCRSDIEITAAGVGCPGESEVVTGASCVSSGPLTTRGDVVPGSTGSVGAVRALAAAPRSERSISSLGGSSDGLTSAAVGGCGWGGTMVLASCFSGVQITTFGIGIFWASFRWVGRLGCTTVWGPGVSCGIRRALSGCGLAPAGGACTLACGPGYLMLPAADRCGCGSVWCRSRCRKSYRSLSIGSLMAGAEMIP